VNAEARRHGGTRPRKLLGENRVEPVVTGLASAVRLGNLESQESVATGFEPDLTVDEALRDELVGYGQQVAVHELPGRFAECLVIGAVQGASHDRSFWMSSFDWFTLRACKRLLIF